MVFVLLLLAVTIFPQPVNLFPIVSSNITELETLNSTNTEDRDAKIEILNQIKTKYNEIEKRINSSTSELEGLTHLLFVEMLRAPLKHLGIVIDQLAAESPDTLKMTDLKKMEKSLIDLEAGVRQMENEIKKYNSKLKEETSEVKTTKQEVEKSAEKEKHQETKEEHDAKIKLWNQIKAKHEIVDKQLDIAVSQIEKEPLIGALFSPMLVASQKYLKRMMGKYGDLDAESLSNLKIEELEALEKKMFNLEERVGNQMIKLQIDTKNLEGETTKEEEEQNDQKENVTGGLEQQLSAIKQNLTASKQKLSKIFDSPNISHSDWPMEMARNRIGKDINTLLAKLDSSRSYNADDISEFKTQAETIKKAINNLYGSLEERKTRKSFFRIR